MMMDKLALVMQSWTELLMQPVVKCDKRNGDKYMYVL